MRNATQALEAPGQELVILVTLEMAGPNVGVQYVVDEAAGESFPADGRIPPQPGGSPCQVQGITLDLITESPLAAESGDRASPTQAPGIRPRSPRNRPGSRTGAEKCGNVMGEAPRAKE